MPKPISFPVAAILAVVLTGSALAQNSGTPGGGAASTDQPAPAQPAPAPPAEGTTPAGAKLPGVTATTNNPNLSVATIKLDNGKRLSKIIGADVYGQDGKALGKVDDLVMVNGDHVTLVVIAAGGFLGLGSKLVAFPFAQLKTEVDRLTLPGITPDTLNGMPNFQY